MKTVVELASDTNSGGVCGTDGGADFNESSRGCCGHAKDETSGTAHEDVGRLVVDGDGGHAETVGAKIDSGQLDLAVGKCGGRVDVVNARQVADGRRGLRGGVRHMRTGSEMRQNEIRNTVRSK
jgi:hypothetical protein